MPASEFPSQPIVQRRSEAEVYSTSPTEQMRFLFSGAAGQPEFYEERAARGDGPPLHRHAWASWEYLVQGRLRVVVDGDEFPVTAGDFFYTPPNAVHAYVVESEQAHMVGFNLPGGTFRDLTREADALIRAAGGAPDPDEFVALAAEHVIEILGPPLDPRQGA